MQIVPEVVSTVGPTMSVKNSKISHFLPFSAVFGLGNVQNDSHTILIIVSDRSLIRRRSIRLDIPIGLDAVLGRLEVGNGQEHFGQGGISVLDDANVPNP